MAARDPRVAVHLDQKTRAKLEWVAGVRGQSTHAFAKALLLAELAKYDDPPAGFGVGLDRDDDE